MITIESLCHFSRSTSLRNISGPISESEFEGFYLALCQALYNNSGGVVVFFSLEPCMPFEERVKFLAALLNNIISRDGRNADSPRDIEKTSWRFRVNQNVVYPMYFSNLYQSNHSRHSLYDADYLVLLNDACFLKAAENFSDTKIPLRVRDSVRWTFEDNGVLYDPIISLSDYECYKIIKPLLLGSPVIRWWDNLY